MTTNVVPSKNEERNVAKEALNYLIEGKRHLVVQDYPSAVSSFQESCKLYAEKYGEMANECGEVYFFYGKALLELARLEIGVLGNALEGVPSEDDDAESEDDQVENPENVTEKEGENPEDEEDDFDEEQNKETEEVVKNDEKERGLSELQPSTSSGEKSTKDNEEDEISNLQLAWEVLELAKVICKRQAEGGDYLMKLKTSEVLLKLGEVSIESENYSQAVDDLNECLQMRKELLQPDDRNLADAFFQLGLAYSLDNQFDNAIEHYEKAIQVIEDRIVNLQKSLKDKLQDSHDDSVNIIKKEIDELNEIIPDIKSKIEDTADIKRNFEETMREAAAERLHTSGEINLSNTDSDSTSQNASPTKAATSIAHLVKRKRKPDEVDEKNSDLQAKKPRPNEDNTSLTSDKTEASGKIQASVGVGEKLDAQAKKRTDIQTT